MGCSWKANSSWYLKWITVRGYAVTFSFSFKAALHFNGKIRLLWKNVSEQKVEIACYGVPRESALRWSVFLGAELPGKPLLPGGSDSRLRPEALGHWRQLSLGGRQHELNFCCHGVWWQGKSLFSADVFWLCGEVENCQEIFFFSSKEVYIKRDLKC